MLIFPCSVAFFLIFLNLFLSSMQYLKFKYFKILLLLVKKTILNLLFHFGGIYYTYCDMKWKFFALLISSFIKSIIIILMSIFIFTKILHCRKIGKYIKTQRRKLKHPKLAIHS